MVIGKVAEYHSYFEIKEMMAKLAAQAIAQRFTRFAVAA
jgi:hypothetical protein